MRRQMKRILLQEDPTFLDTLKKVLPEYIPEGMNIIYLSDPEEALRQVGTDEAVLAITSNLFRSKRFLDGVTLAKAIKKQNPQAIVYIFSAMPPKIGESGIDGIIPKTGDLKVLASILGSEDGDIARARQFFPDHVS